MPNALLIYPEFPSSYWGIQHALSFVGKKSFMPPLGLLTIAGMFPANHELRVVDMNVGPLTDADLAWADVVFTSSMIIQKESLRRVIERCNRAGVPVVAGGPHPTTFHEEIMADFPDGGGADHFILGEAEETFPRFLEDFARGKAAAIYREGSKPDVGHAPLPRYDLIDIRAYSSMAVQFSRGCPFDCEFCDITKLFGRVTRTKAPDRMLEELELLYRHGWRGPVFVVDDNFVGNKRRAMELLTEVAEWQEARGYPFALFTEATVNLVNIPGFLEAMRRSGFDMVFLGIESPNRDALLSAHKAQNTRKAESSSDYLLRAVREIQDHGIEVTAGFIMGLDGDHEFESHLRFIEEAGIPMAMVGLLHAVKGTNLHDRLSREGRLLTESSGNNTDLTLNFVPELPGDALIAEYRRVMSRLYGPSLRSYFDRCWTLLRRLQPAGHGGRSITFTEIRACLRSLCKQLPSRHGPSYALLLLKVLLRRPGMLPEAVRLAIVGYHFEKITRAILRAAEPQARATESPVTILESRRGIPVPERA